MLDFYKEKYEHMLNENRNLTQEKEKSLNIFTSIIILAVFPILDAILDINIIGYKIANLIIFGVLILSVLITLIWTFYLYVIRYEEIEITNMYEAKKEEDFYEKRAEEIIKKADSINEKKEIEKKFRKAKEDKIINDYIKRYNLLFNNYKDKNKKLKIYYILIIISVCIEVVLLILLGINKIFL